MSSLTSFMGVTMRFHWSRVFPLLLAAACGDTVPPVRDAGAEPLDSGSDSGVPTRAIDLRFRGVGETLAPVPLFGFGGGPLPGAGTLVATRNSPAFGAGLFVSDFLLWFGVTYENATEYDTRVYVAGSECDRWLSEEMARGATVLGLGGDSTRGDGTCTLLGVRAVDAGVAVSYLSGLSLASSAIDFLNQHDDTRRYVVTALSEVDAGPVCVRGRGARESADSGTVRSQLRACWVR